MLTPLSKSIITGIILFFVSLIGFILLGCFKGSFFSSIFIAFVVFILAFLISLVVFTRIASYKSFLAEREKRKLEYQPPFIITEQTVVNYCRANNGTSFMCKNCGGKYDAIQVARQYCEGCDCWICSKCSGEKCGECRAI